MLFDTKIARTDLSCSISNLFATSLPMILSTLTGTIMHTFDRVLLSHYSVESMNGAALACHVLECLALPLLTYATISEVFVGQYNGAAQFKKTSIPVFQITIFLLAILAVATPIALKYGRTFIPSALYKEGFAYFFWGLLTVPFQIMGASIAAFFVGTRRSATIFSSVAVANVLNVILDIPFIFGWWIIPAMGAKGAAIASLIASVVSVMMLLYFFLNEYNSENYNTRHICIDWQLLWKNLTIGSPIAISELVEMIVWVALINILAAVSIASVTVHNIAITLWIFFVFVTDGFQKGVIALASNCLGAGKDFFIKKLIRSMGVITLVFAICSSSVLVFLQEVVVRYIFGINDPVVIAQAKPVLILLWMTLTLILIVQCCLHGILSSVGDTKFLTYVRCSTIILFLGVPILIFSHYGRLTVQISWLLCVIQYSVNGAFFYWRYKSGKWKNKLIN
jgi:MATE family multidrug resistance protein